MTTREMLIGSGEHIAAIRQLPSEYTAEQYVAAVNDARMVNAGERYADACLGPDVISAVDEGEEMVGEEILAKAMSNLRVRGIFDPSYQQLTAALVEATS